MESVSFPPKDSISAMALTKKKNEKENYNKERK